jgi:hypothetical protein
MSLALLQKGTGGALVVCAGPMPQNDQPWGLPLSALKALGPQPCIVACNARGVETMDEILAFAKEKTGRQLWLAALVGFSAGCQKVRALWLAGSAALALVLADGLHAHNPPDAAQIDYARGIVAKARSGALLTIILHTYIATKPDITSTVEMARAVTGWPLAMPPAGQTVRRREGRLTTAGDWPGLVVYSTGSGPFDKSAHEGQALRVLPLALAAHVRQLVELDARPADVDTHVEPGAASTPEPPAELVLLQAVGAELPRAVASSPTPPVAVKRIVLVGDSLAQGLGPMLAEIARRVPFAFHAVGKQSTRVRDWMHDSDLLAAIGTPPADLVLVCLGTNDMRAADPAGAGAEAGALIDKIFTTGASVAWIGPPRMTFDTGAFRPALSGACGPRNVRICDSQSLDLERAPDGIHLTPKGYRAWAETIAAWVPFASYAAGSGAVPSAARDGAAALLTLRAQLDAQWPSRSRAADGIAPSAAHHAANPKSDHEVGNAFDITNDPENGPDLAALATALLTDARAHYVIFQRRIANPEKEGGAWRPYTGTSTHEDHLHLSIYAGRRDDRREWDLAGVGVPASPAVATGPVGPIPTISMPTALTVQGFGRLALEDYVARVVTAELGASRQLHALEAQAMAARSYVVWMMSNQGYGTPAKPVPNSTHFQVCARAATALCLQATAATRGGLVLHGGRLVLTSYVAGALWSAGASTGRNGSDPTKTEHGVTYNDGLLDTAVRPTPNAGPIVDNRGCLSQNGAVELGRRGVLWPAILRYFYGADLDFTCPAPSTPAPVIGRDRPARPLDAPPPGSPTPAPTPSDDGNGTKDGGSLLIAAGVAAYRMFT